MLLILQQEFAQQTVPHIHSHMPTTSLIDAQTSARSPITVTTPPTFVFWTVLLELTTTLIPTPKGVSKTVPAAPIGSVSQIPLHVPVLPGALRAVTLSTALKGVCPDALQLSGLMNNSISVLKTVLYGQDCIKNKTAKNANLNAPTPQSKPTSTNPTTFVFTRLVCSAAAPQLTTPIPWTTCAPNAVQQATLPKTVPKCVCRPVKLVSLPILPTGDARPAALSLLNTMLMTCIKFVSSTVLLPSSKTIRLTDALLIAAYLPWCSGMRKLANVSKAVITPSSPTLPIAPVSPPVLMVGLPSNLPNLVSKLVTTRTLPIIQPTNVLKSALQILISMDTLKYASFSVQPISIEITPQGNALQLVQFNPWLTPTIQQTLAWKSVLLIKTFSRTTSHENAYWTAVPASSHKSTQEPV